MKIIDHKLGGARYDQTAHIGDVIAPTLIVVHGTGTRIDKGSAVDYCKKNARKVSYHIIIERDGEVVQLAPLNRRVNHAGRSSWKGRQWCNSFSISIGLVDPGKLKGTPKKAMSFYREWFTEFDGLQAKDTPHHGRGHIWLPYTPEQHAAINEVVAAIKAAYPGIDIAGHYQISPGRKIDPTPLIDIAALGGTAPTLDEGMAVAVESTHKTLAKKSREYKSTNILGSLMAGGAVSTSVLEAVSISNIQATKTYLDVFTGFVKAYSAPVVIGACVFGWLVCEAIKHWKRESYEAGNYVPSGDT